MFVEMHEGRRGAILQSLTKWVTSGFALLVHAEAVRPALLDDRIKSGHDGFEGVHTSFTVTNGLDPLVHAEGEGPSRMDAQIKSGHDGFEGVHNSFTVTNGLDPLVHTEGEKPSLMDTRIKSRHDRGRNGLSSSNKYLR